LEVNGFKPTAIPQPSSAPASSTKRKATCASSSTAKKIKTEGEAKAQSVRERHIIDISDSD
jgi:hypothetical protein